jgi:hypothetical protein
MQSPDTTDGKTRSAKVFFGLDLGVTVVLAVLQLLLSWTLRFVIGVLSMRSTGCTPIELCNFDLAGAAVNVMPYVGGAAVILTAVLGVKFGKRGRPIWHAGAFGLALISVAFVIAAGLNYWALTPSAG